MLYRAALFTLALIAVAVTDHPVVLLLFVVISFWIYFSQTRERGMLRVSYWFVVGLALVIVLLQASSTIPVVGSLTARLAVAVLFGIALWSVLKLVRFSFTDSSLPYSLLNTATLVALFIAFFHMAVPYKVGLSAIALFVLLFLLLKEAFSFFGLVGRRSWVISAIVALLSFELAWFLLILPLGVLNATAFLVLFLVLVRDILAAREAGNLTTSLIFRQFTFLVLIVLIIFAASSWYL